MGLLRSKQVTVVQAGCEECEYAAIYSTANRTDFTAQDCIRIKQEMGINACGLAALATSMVAPLGIDRMAEVSNSAEQGEFDAS